MPTLSSLLSVTTIAPSNETEGFESTNSTASLSAKNSTNPELDTELINGTESSGDLVREVAQAEQSLTSSFDKRRLSSVTTVRPALKLFAAPMKEDSKCEMSTITGKSSAVFALSFQQIFRMCFEQVLRFVFNQNFEC